MTKLQRAVLVVAAIFLLFFAMISATSYEGDQWLATAQFLVAIILLVVAARRSSNPNP